MSTFFLAIVITILTEKVVEPRLGPYTGDAVAEAPGAASPDESKGLRYALWGFLVTVLLVGLRVRAARSTAAQRRDRATCSAIRRS